MARRCCVDSVAMKVIASDDAETEGHLVPCRWCNGYGRYEGGAWHYAEDEPSGRRQQTEADLWTHPVRQARVQEVLHGKAKA